MSTKRKIRQTIAEHADTTATKRQHELDRARRAHAKGTMCLEDFIWTAVQCYAADTRNTSKTSNRFS